MAVDPRQNGLAPIRGLNRLQQYQQQPTQEDLEYMMLQRQNKLSKKGGSSVYRPEIGTFTESKHYEPGTPGYEKGLSRYDREEDALTTPTSFEELNQSRYENQSAWDVLANGLIKTAGRTATSFINSMVGGIFGIGTAIARRKEEDWWTGFWDNPLSNAMADVDDWFNENFTNYQSLSQQQNERNGEWYKNLGSLNMWMDDVLTNTGFTLGMMAAATTGAGLLGIAAKAMKGVGLVEKYGAQAAKAITLLNSTAGEAATEALGAQREHIQSETQRINDNIDMQIASDPNVQQLDMNYQQQLSALDTAFGYNRNDPNYKQYRQQLDQQYQQQRGQLTAQYEQHRSAAMEQMQDEANSLGLAVGLGNMAILGISNFNLAGRFVDKAYNNAVKSAGNSIFARNSNIGFRNAFGQHNVTGNAATGYGSRSAVGNISKRIASNVLSEGIYEEMGQGALTAGAKSYYAYEDVDNYWRARLDPDSVDMTADGSHDFLKAVGNGLNETYGSAEGWKEGFIGGITGALFGAAETRQEWKNTRYAKRAAKDLNNALANPKMQTLLQHLVAQGFHAQNKERLAEEGNQSDWKTEDDKALFSIISAFARAGKMDDLHEMLRQESERMSSMSDDDLNKLISDSTKVTTAEQQKAALRQGIDDKLNAAIESLLKDGATAGDLNQAQAAVQQAKQAEQQALQEAQRAEQGVQAASRLRNVDRVAMNRLRERSRNASQKAQEAARARKAAEDNVALMFKEGRGLNDVNRLLAERDQHMQDIDSQDYTDIYDGPFVDADGNRMTAKDVHEKLKHNVESLQQSVQHYQDAIEEVNRRTRGMFSKDEEDYLAYNFFLDKTHVDRGDNLLKPWRGVLPERVPLQIPKGKAKRLAKALGISEDAIQEDPDKEGQVWVSTKDMTDEQYADFMMNGFLGQTHLTRVNGNGQVMREATEQYRKQMRDEALKAIEDEMKRSGKVKSFDRDKFQRDMEDAAKAYAKAHNYQRARAEMMQNPEKLMTSKQKFLRNLKRSWDKKKAKLMQKKMSIQQLGDLTDEQMNELDDYHFALAKAEKVRRAVQRYWDRRAPEIYEQIEDAFDNIKDPELRQELINRVKKRIDDYILRRREEGTDEIEDIDAEEIQALFDFNDIIPPDDELWSKIDKEAQKAISKGLKMLRSLGDGLAAAITSGKLFAKVIGEKLDSLRKKAKDTSIGDDINEDSPYSSIISSIRQIIGGKLSDKNKDKLRKLLDAAQKKVDRLEQSKPTGYKQIVSALRAVIKAAEKAIASDHNKKKPDTERHSAPPSGGNSAAKRSKKKATGAAAASGVAGTQATEHNQNPDQDYEERTIIQAAAHIEEPEMATSDIWQSVTGEFARRSGFTYEAYHTIVDDALRQWDEAHPNPTEDDLNRPLLIPVLGEKGSEHTIAEWRELAHRSRIIHDLIKNRGDFNHIDRGNVRRGDSITFKLVRKEGQFIVLLVHNGHIIGDLSHPKYGGNGSGLAEMYDKFEKEYDEKVASSKDGIVDSKYHTSVANVYAGSLCYAEAKDGVIPTKTVASLGAGTDQLQFFIAGVSDPSSDPRDAVGEVKSGQPYVLVPMPSNDGLTRKKAVPVMTKPMSIGGLEFKVVVKAIEKFGKDKHGLQKFLQHFLNCRSASVFEVVEGEETSTVIKLTSVTLENGEPATAEIKVKSDGNIEVSGSVEAVRANVSFALLNGRYGVTMYEDIVKGTPELPQTYNDFLKQICHTSLIDLRVHNSWITVNKLRFEGDNAVEVPDPEQQTNKLRDKGADTIVIRDDSTNESYRITVKEDNLGNISIARVEYAHNRQLFRTRRVTERTRQKMLPIIAQAVMNAKRAYTGQLSFELDGVVYEFNVKRNGKLKPIRSDKQIDVKSFDEQLANAFQNIAEQYDGTDASIDKIIADWFDEGFHKKGSQRYKDLRDLLQAVKSGKRSFTGLPIERKTALLNALRSETAQQRRSKQLAEALADLFQSKGIPINTDAAEAQSILDNWRRGGLSSPVQPFYKDGKTLYGFVYKGTIYLDTTIMNAETLIHEYTHLWCNALRASDNPKHRQMWKDLVAELRTNPLWKAIKETYKYTDENAIADEVFAKIAGRDGEQWLLDKVAETQRNQRDKKKKELDEKGKTDLEEMSIKEAFEQFRSTLKKLLDYIKEHILGIRKDAQTVGDMMKDLVWHDMLSDEAVAAGVDMVAENKFGPVAEEPHAKPTRFKVSQFSFTDPDSEDRFFDNYEDNIEEVDGEEWLNVPAGESIDDIADKYGFTVNEIQAQIDFIQTSESSRKLNDAVGNKLMSLISSAVSAGHIPSLQNNGLSSVISRMSQYIARDHIRGNDFIVAAELTLAEEQRDRLWKEALSLPGMKDKHGYQIAAELSHLFNRYLQGEDISNATIKSLFSEMHDGIKTLTDNEGAVRDYEDAGILAIGPSIASPSDPISRLSSSERSLAYGESLDMLTEQDKEFLRMAGYTEAIYSALPQTSKERIRKCIL